MLCVYTYRRVDVRECVRACVCACCVCNCVCVNFWMCLFYLWVCFVLCVCVHVSACVCLCARMCVYVCMQKEWIILCTIGCLHAFLLSNDNKHARRYYLTDTCSQIVLEDAISADTSISLVGVLARRHRCIARWWSCEAFIINCHGQNQTKRRKRIFF